jgi:hypothetical protein
MTSVLPERRQVNVRTLFETALAEAHATLLTLLSTRLNALLSQAMDELLGRSRYERRGHVSPAVQGGRCPHCQRRQSQRFSRHGGRWRTVTIYWGDLRIYWPRVRCECVQLQLAGWLAPLSALGRGRRCPHSTLGRPEPQPAPDGRRTGAQLHRPVSAAHLDHAFTSTPGLDAGVDDDERPAVQVDGFYITQLRPNGEVRTDAKGRKRAVKGRFKRCVLIALGVWPETGRQEVLAWALTEGEDFMAWLSFLSQLEAAGIAVEHGLQVLIQDGSSGLAAQQFQISTSA